MDIIIGLIAVSLTIAIGFLILFLWNLRNGQYDDTITPAIRILFDDHKKDLTGPSTEAELKISDNLTRIILPADDDQNP